VPTHSSLAAALLFLALASPCRIARAQSTAPGQPAASSPAAAPALDEATTRLFEAAMLGNMTDVRAALASKAVVDATNDGHMTPLGVAALHGHANVVSALVAAGASVTADQDGETPLMLAAHEGHAAVVDALLAGGADVAAKNKDGADGGCGSKSRGGRPNVPRAPCGRQRG
jgi:ankyrin repeat protein